MLASFLIAFREGVEIAVIFGIVVSTLRKLNRKELYPVVWSGFISAMAASIIIAVVLQKFGATLEGRAEQIFESATMLLAASILTWMIFWMQSQSRSIKGEIENSVRLSISETSNWALFSLAFIAIWREGVELAIYVTASTFASEVVPVLIGTILGLAASLILGIGIYSASIRLDLRFFFDFTSALLILFAAGLVANGFHELIEGGILPPIIPQVWDLSLILDPVSMPGRFLSAFFGYQATPSLLEMIFYFLYLGGVLILLRQRELIKSLS
jgi:high-affinity iron transporter